MRGKLFPECQCPGCIEFQKILDSLHVKEVARYLETAYCRSSF